MNESSHWYTKEGLPCYEVKRAKGDGMRPTTLADARKLNLLPSVTTITRVLNAPALVEWKIRNAIEAALTTPRMDGESIDDFASRVLAVDTESIADAAKQLGTDVHTAIELALAGEPYQADLERFVAPACVEVRRLGYIAATERILVGESYAGKTDCITENDGEITVWDFKTTKAKKLPKESYPEHRLQLAAYAGALGNTGNKRVTTFNIYISTINPGQISVCENADWQSDFAMFKRTLELWQWMNDYRPVV